jgi:hypothetical protein
LQVSRKNEPPSIGKEEKMSENKRKYAYWLEPSLVEDMETMLKEANATSKGDFVRQAIKFYMAYLRQGKSLDFLSPLLAQTIKSEIESVEQNIAAMLFKVAVEQGKLSNIMAFAYEVSEDKMDALHDYCSGTVAETNGVISFADAYEHQRGE